MAIIVNADGLCERNPGGIACYGWVARRDGVKVGEGWGEVARGPGATNNLAEYRAVIAALEWLLAEGLAGERVLVRSDSQLVIRQIQGEYAVKSERILPLYRRVRKLAGRFAFLRFEWVPRERNYEADLLSRRAYGEALAGERAGRSQGLPVEPVGGTVFRVRSSDGSKWYEVDVALPECSCPDFARHRGIPGFACKHILAARRVCGRGDSAEQAGLVGAGSVTGGRGGCGAG